MVKMNVFKKLNHITRGGDTKRCGIIANLEVGYARNAEPKTNMQKSLELVVFPLAKGLIISLNFLRTRYLKPVKFLKSISRKFRHIFLLLRFRKISSIYLCTSIKQTSFYGEYITSELETGRGPDEDGKGKVTMHSRHDCAGTNNEVEIKEGSFRAVASTAADFINN